MASIVKLPNPGIAKNASITKPPTKRYGIDDTTFVKSGIMAFLSACLKRITDSLKPFARAVRT
jgi:hypothetical protein